MFLTIKFILLAVIFVATSGAVFSKYFKSNLTLTIMASIVAIIGSTYLISDIYKDISTHILKEVDKKIVKKTNSNNEDSKKIALPKNDDYFKNKEKSLFKTNEGSTTKTTLNTLPEATHTKNIDNKVDNESSLNISFDINSIFTDLQFSNKDKKIFFSDLDDIGVFNNEKVEYLLHTGQAYSLDRSNDNKQMAIGISGGILRIWDLELNQEHIKQIDAHVSSIEDVKYSSDGKYLATASRDKTIKIWNKDTYSLAYTLKGHKHSPDNMVKELSYDQKNKFLASSDNLGNIIIWNSNNYKKIRDLTPYSSKPHLVDHRRRVLSLDFSKNGKLLAFGGRDGSVGIYDTQNWKLIKMIQAPGKAHLREVHKVLFADKDNSIYFITVGGLVGRYTLSTKKVTYFRTIGYMDSPSESADERLKSMFESQGEIFLIFIRDGLKVQAETVVIKKLKDRLM